MDSLILTPSPFVLSVAQAESKDALMPPVPIFQGFLYYGTGGRGHPRSETSESGLPP